VAATTAKLQKLADKRGKLESKLEELDESDQGAFETVQTKLEALDDEEQTLTKDAEVHYAEATKAVGTVFLLLDLPAPHSVTPGRDDYPVPTDAPFTGENWPQAAKNRAALVTRLDNALGHLTEQLQAMGLTNNVAIFIAGLTAPEPFANTNLDFLKLPNDVRGGTSPDHLRVPLIVNWPGHVRAGRVIATPCRAVDFTPTAADMAGLEPIPDLAGTSLLPPCSAGQRPTHRPGRQTRRPDSVL